MTAPAGHLWRLLKWGRILAPHGALRGIERDPNTPPSLRRLVKLARFGARVPDTPRYADAFQAIGPAAIKLGQTLATRPDLDGEDAAHDLMRLQDALPPLPFATIRPAIEEEFAKAIDTYQWAAAQAEAMGGELSRLRPRLVIETFKRWTARELDLRREAASASELAEAMHAEPDYLVPAIDWQRTSGRVMTLQWIEGIKLAHRDRLLAAGQDPKQLADILVNAFLRQAISEGFFHADMHQGNLFATPDGKIAAIDFGIMV